MVKLKRNELNYTKSYSKSTISKHSSYNLYLFKFISDMIQNNTVIPNKRKERQNKLFTKDETGKNYYWLFCTYFCYFPTKIHMTVFALPETLRWKRHENSNKSFFSHLYI